MGGAAQRALQERRRRDDHRACRSGGGPAFLRAERVDEAMTKVAIATTAGHSEASSPGRRRPDVEWLRVAGMLIVFAIHAAEPFNPWDTWHVENLARSKWLGELAFFPAPWIMPLFMILAGESAWHALATRSARLYVRERVLHLGVPLVAGILVLVPPQVYLERRLRGQFGGSFLEFYPHFFEGIYPRGNFAWHHLWFLVFLLVFAIVTIPLAAWLRGPAGRRAMARLAAPCGRRAGLVWLLLPAVATRIGIELLFAGFPPLAYDWSNRGLLLLAFVSGLLLAGEPAFRRAVDRHWRTALVVAVAASSVLCAWAWPGDVLARLPSPRSPGGILLWGGYACAAWCWLVALLGGARRFVTWRSEALERASELTYPFYVLHHPVVVAVAYVVVQRHASVLAAFLAVVAASLSITVLLCALVASSGTLRVLFGLRRQRAQPPAMDYGA